MLYLFESIQLFSQTNQPVILKDLEKCNRLEKRKLLQASHVQVEINFDLDFDS
jgi:hypothetical protein